MTRSLHHNPRYASGSFGLSYHLEMLSDIERVDRCKHAIKSALQAVGPDAVFCELGCGTGIFSIFAAHYCRKVYAVENDPVVFSVAERHIQKLGLSQKLELIRGDALDVPIPEDRIDVLFCEMMSIWLVTEPQVKVIQRWLRGSKGPITYVIPQRVINIAELGQVDYHFDDLEIKADLPQFSGIRPPRVMTESRVVHEVVLNDERSLLDEVNAACEFQALVSGCVNCARLSSVVEFFPDITFFSTDTLMPSTIVPLSEELWVKEGDRVRFEVSYSHRSELSSASFRAFVAGR
ncbi:MAG TPA: methyltransferase domain-containing protein [Thermoanaerobaculia bacterium]|jgi:predicted RNA methylase|nr:methyltransferase domain-containing protein [Thermoanaerobaculia bacterium]